MEIFDKSHQLESRTIGVVQKKIQQPPLGQILRNWSVRNNIDRKGQVVQRSLSIGGIEKEDEFTAVEVADESVRDILNGWIAARFNEKFDSLDAAIAGATALIGEGVLLVGGINDMIGRITHENISDHWREIEILVREAIRIQNCCGDPAGEIYDKKYELMDKVNGFNIQDYEISDEGIFEKKRADVIDAYIANEIPPIPEVDEHNLAGRVANAERYKVGHLHWTQGDGEDNTFREWVKDDTIVLDDNSYMNCWEAIFYSACQANLMTKQAIKDLYEHVDDVDDVFLMNLQEAIGEKQTLFSVIEKGGLQRGDIILTTGWIGDHVAMSMGGKQVLSLWNRPGADLKLQLTTLDQIVDDVNQPLVVRNSPLFISQ